MAQVRADVAHARVDVSDLQARHSRLGGLFMFRVARERVVKQVRDLVPDERLWFAVSRTGINTYAIEVFASTDHDRVKQLLGRLRQTRKTWKGYRTMDDYYDANPT